MRAAALRVALVFGTRPEAIKMAPIVFEMRKRRASIRPIVIVTSQHGRMLRQALDLFGIRPDHDLGIMHPAQDLFDISVKVLQRLRRVLREVRPDVVLVQGDTSSTFCSALAARYLGIPVGHVEAGLRTRDRLDPFPEELNRRLVGTLADLHFAPTEWAKRNLLKESVESARILVTGNTAIDALHWVVKRFVPGRSRELRRKFRRLEAHRRLLMVTAHRRESFGAPLEGILRALRKLLERNPETCIAFPVHLNPAVQRAAHSFLDGVERAYLMDPLDYGEFAYLVKRCHFVLTDSGGIQEEAPALGKPVLVLRRKTERPEGVKAGTNVVVGTDERRIVREAERLLHDEAAYARRARIRNPFGDGRAARRIVDGLLAGIP